MFFETFENSYEYPLGVREGGGGWGGEKNAHFGQTACKIRYNSLCIKFGT